MVIRSILLLDLPISLYELPFFCSWTHSAFRPFCLLTGHRISRINSLFQSILRKKTWICRWEDELAYRIWKPTLFLRLYEMHTLYRIVFLELLNAWWGHSTVGQSQAGGGGGNCTVEPPKIHKIIKKFLNVFLYRINR